MHKAFISYHHRNDQWYKDHLVRMNDLFNIFIDRSVETGDISENLEHQTIRRIIRDQRLRDSTATILLLGTETRFRKHVDWELKSSMIDGAINKRSGISRRYAAIDKLRLMVDVPSRREGANISRVCELV